MSSIGDWLGKNIQFILDTPKHDDGFTFIMEIVLEYFILKHLTTLTIKIDQLTQQSTSCTNNAQNSSSISFLNVKSLENINESPSKKDNNLIAIKPNKEPQAGQQVSGIENEIEREDSSFSVASHADSEQELSQQNEDEVDLADTFGANDQNLMSQHSLIQLSEQNILTHNILIQRLPELQDQIFKPDSKINSNQSEPKVQQLVFTSFNMSKDDNEEQKQLVQKDEDQLEEVRALQCQVKELEAKIEANKVFTYMVIHDLKHPTESVLSQLEMFEVKLKDALDQQNTLINLGEQLNAAAIDNLNFITSGLDELINEIQTGLKEVEKEIKDVDFLNRLQNSKFSSVRNSDESQQLCDSPQIIRENKIPKKSNFSFQQEQIDNSDSSSIDCDIQEGTLLMPYIQIDTKQKNQVNKVSNLEPQFSSLTHKRLWNSLSNVIQHRGDDAQRFQIEISDKQKVLVKQFSDSNHLKNKEQNQTLSNKKIATILQRQSQKCQDIGNSLCASIVTFSKQQKKQVQQFQNLGGQNITNLQELMKFVKIMLFSTKMMQNLMMDLLDLAQIEKSTFKLNKEFFSLFDVIKQVFQMVSHVADKKMVELISPNTSKEDEQYFMKLYGDKNRFVQVIINFLSNSLKFSDQGSKIILHLEILQNQRLANSDFFKHKSINESLKNSLNVSINNEEIVVHKSIDLNDFNVSSSENSLFFASESSVRKKQTNYINFKLTIQDFGCGIPDDKLKNLFLNFSNLQEHQKVNPTGRGLGLSICKSIVEQMGGRVKVQSQVGVGSKFSMTFKTFCNLEISSESSRNKQPVEEISPEQQQFIHVQQEIGNMLMLNQSLEIIRTDAKKPRVLIANDEIYLLCGYQFQLESLFQVETAENGMQALQMVTSNPVDYFDLIILDINMPIMDGIESCQLIYKYLHSYQVEKSPLEGLLQQKSNQPDKTQYFTPFIYALTGECSPESLKRILKQPFEKVLNNISVDNIQMFLTQIKKKRSQFAIPDMRNFFEFQVMQEEESPHN